MKADGVVHNAGVDQTARRIERGDLRGEATVQLRTRRAHRAQFGGLGGAFIEMIADRGPGGLHLGPRLRHREIALGQLPASGGQGEYTAHQGAIALVERSDLGRLVAAMLDLPGSQRQGDIGQRCRAADQADERGSGRPGNTPGAERQPDLPQVTARTIDERPVRPGRGGKRGRLRVDRHPFLLRLTVSHDLSGP